MLLKEAETVEDGASSCSDLLLLDFSLSPSIQFSFVVFGSLDWDNVSIVAVSNSLAEDKTNGGIGRGGSFGESVVHRPRSYLCRIASISFPM